MTIWGVSLVPRFFGSPLEVQVTKYVTTNTGGNKFIPCTPFYDRGTGDSRTSMFLYFHDHGSVSKCWNAVNHKHACVIERTFNRLFSFMTTYLALALGRVMFVPHSPYNPIKKIGWAICPGGVRRPYTRERERGRGLRVGIADPHALHKEREREREGERAGLHHNCSFRVSPVRPRPTNAEVQEPMDQQGTSPGRLRLTLHTPAEQTNGVRQGSPDSPDLSASIIARDLQAAIANAPRPTRKGDHRRPKQGEIRG